MKKQKKVKENASNDWMIPPLCAEDSKYTRGHVVVLGGDEMTGAAKLSALAAQRAGAGLVTIAASPQSWPIYAASMMSVMTRAVNARQWSLLLADPHINAVVIGPGAGVNARTAQAMRAGVGSGKPLILDADALTLMAQNAPLRAAMMNAPKILTPHAGECARLMKALRIAALTEQATVVCTLAKRLNAVVVLKGSETLVSDGVRVYVTHPPHWLATAGTGDVLAGIIAALVGQGMTLLDAANAGVWIHAKAARRHGRGMIAEDVIATIPAVLQKCQ